MRTSTTSAVVNLRARPRLASPASPPPRRAEILVRIKSSDQALAEARVEVNLLLLPAGMVSAAAPELLAALVPPTDPSINISLREASDKLSNAGRSPAIDGYAAGKKTRAWEIAEAVWGPSTVPHLNSLRKLQAPGPDGACSRRARRTCLDLGASTPHALNRPVSIPSSPSSKATPFAGFWLVDEDFRRRPPRRRPDAPKAPASW